MSDNGVTNPPGVSQQPHIFGEVEPDELQRLAGLRQQASGILNQIAQNRVQEHNLMAQLRQAEGATNQIVDQVGQRLGIAKGTAWSVTSDGKAIAAGPMPPPVPNMAPVPDQSEETTPEA